MLNIQPRNPTLLYTQFSFAVKGESKNEYNNHSAICSFVYKFIVVDKNSMGLYSTGRQLP